MRAETIGGGATGPATPSRLEPAALDRIFHKGRTYNAFLDRPVPDALLHEAVELAVQGPTALNSLPLRVVFLRSAAAKARLEPALAEGNRAKTMAAPVTAILAYDLKFYDHLPRLFPHVDARARFAGSEAAATATARTSGTLQAGYFILALRSLGLDAGPMGGFDNAKVDAEFFADGRFRSNILVNIGYGNPEGLHPRGPRFAPQEIAEIL
ncbi:malonic semialdehyde reductase [Labrys monachus]|uniref:Putative NADH dehydrogenase/NAD(P)H nitroreductase J3R73_006255 n=1 Tax=Labrys monachus TaxID=217067 RepID=A0ABU0FPC1_9HYPH|nr:malonic semialdehyde reductase [Labrys monachus]MDQ0396463.1 3-hydroxypropanoate dehydrogenase [Labrys monachus]